MILWIGVILSRAALSLAVAVSTMAEPSSEASSLSSSSPPPRARAAAGPSKASLIRLLAGILVLGVFSNLSSQISVANNDMFAGLAGGRPDEPFAMHVANEKSGQVAKLSAEVQRLRAELDEAKKNGSATRSSIGQSSAAEREEAATATAATTNTEDREGVCSILPQSAYAPDASSIWNHHLADIHKSIRHPMDTDYVFHDLTASILYFLNPIRLQRSILAPPTDYAHVGRVLEVAYTRYRYLRDSDLKGQVNDDGAPPPLNILVMGGSVAMGVVCKTNPITTQGLGRYSRRACAWPVRLESFLNNIFKADVVRVHTVTLGGSNTESGITIWKYGLQPEDQPHPDILINAYSTNDVHVNSVAAAKAKNQTIQDAVWDLTQQFIRTAVTGCEPPLLVYYDDYIGNEQNEILETTKLSQAIHLLSRYYGTMAISYANAVRDLVYRGTDEEWFSPHEWFVGEQKEWTRQIHPGMSMHFASTLVVSYNFLQMLTTFCSLHPSQINVGDAQQQQQETEGWDYGYKSVNGLPVLKNGPVPKGPRPKPDALPPWLDDELNLESISNKWQEEVAKASTIPSDQSDCVVKRPCVFSFVSGLERDLHKPAVLAAKLKPYLSQNGWNAQDDNAKNGWVPMNGVGSKFTFELKQLSQRVTVVTFMVMKSYGEKWQGSKIRINASFRADTNGQYESLAEPMEISGEHDKQTSETYNYEMDLTITHPEGAAIGSDLKVDVELIGGTTFKIMGLAFCDIQQ